MKSKLMAILFSIVSLSGWAQKTMNPVIDQDFPDPTVVRVGDTYYAYATNSDVEGKTLNIQVASSKDLQNWKIEGDALPNKPTWAATDFWAPHVLYDDSLKQYVLFYSGESNDQNVGKCMGVAFSDNPLGPFVDMGNPLLCGDTFINIDPMAFIDPKTGKKLLYWGSGHEPIKVQELSSDWKSFKNGTSPKPVILPRQEKKYDQLVEGAWVDYYKGKYYLYYSGDNCCGEKASYAVLVARSEDPFGPFTRLGEERKNGTSVILEKDDS
ncbi:glycoside hydrolase family 43 protein [Sabulibacter ruber]|uniref:glycoside hydrolase family 43 protein n=1 Tax=Sabulibacter ruber TaxID=2811901 RepID=UPI001A9711C2|nr:glycoside hydrolase family 43 protein [Sabulibacter ruber]